MKRFFAALAVATLVFAGTNIVLAGKHMEKMTVKGELVDLTCYMTMDEGKGSGKGHAECAKKCAMGGAPVGLKAADGKVYLVISDHDHPKVMDQVKEHCGHEGVSVTGMHTMKGEMHVMIAHEVTM